jgi:hypothetical protein
MSRLPSPRGILHFYSTGVRPRAIGAQRLRSMITAVIDTNILVAAMRSRQGGILQAHR